ncbi:MAG: ketose-bisphosphate aldolase [Desulfobulbaceae bacterium]|nr:MAG: ketose-bisphosphate aldolase [Desulfobulbaceae bacterium]
MTVVKADFDRALTLGRPPNITGLFPNSRALIVSGKVIDRAMLRKGRCMTIAANARNSFIIRGALSAAQRANAAIIIEIARSEGGAKAYCPINYWNMATMVDAAMNELGISIPVAIHADHYVIKKDGDIDLAKVEIPTMFEAGITSIAIDASHLSDDKNLLTNLSLSQMVPTWAGYETEVGEIKGTSGLSTVDEALFLIQGLNAHNIFPDWIALNNGTTHGIEASGTGIDVELTRKIHDRLAPYQISGAQHGTSGNSKKKLQAIAQQTRTTKANVATALQMVAWGVDINDYGNAKLDSEGRLVKIKNEGVTDAIWEEMKGYAAAQGWQAGNYKNLNLPFENRLLGQPLAIRQRMSKRVDDFVYHLLTEVFNAKDTAELAVAAILRQGSHDLGAKGERLENPTDWTGEKIVQRAATLDSDKGPAGDFDD